MYSRKMKIYYVLVLLVTLVASFFAGYYTTLKYASRVLDDNKINTKAVAQTMDTKSSDLITTSTKILRRDKYIKGVEYVVQTVDSPSSDILGMDMGAVEKFYKNKGYILLEFNTKQIIISKDIDSWPPNTYVVKGENDSINIYSVGSNGKLIFQKSTDLRLGDLPDQDKEEIIKGKIYENSEAIDDLIDEYKS